MGIFQQFPYSNFHEMNLDQILKMMRELSNKMDNFVIHWSEEIEENVDRWLDEHPEATTTVQDHSLNYEKLIIDTLGFVTPEMLGAVGDGITDDRDAFNAAGALGTLILADNSKTYYLSDYVTLEANTTLIGGNYVIPSASVGSSVFRLNGDNIAVDGCTITSTNDKTAIIGGSTPAPGSLSSNRYAFHFTPRKNISIRNVSVKNIYSLVFITAPDTSDYSEHVYIDNCTVINGTLPIFAAMCKDLRVSNCYLHTSTNANNTAFHSCYLTYGVDGAVFSNNTLINEGVATGFHFQVGSSDYTLYGLECENLFVNGGSVKGASFGDFANCSNCFISNVYSDIVESAANLYRCMSIADNVNNLIFDNCTFNHTGRQAVWFDNNGVSETVFNNCRFAITTRTVLYTPPTIKCVDCTFEVTALDSSYPSVITVNSYDYNIEFIGCNIVSSNRCYFITGVDTANCNLLLKNCCMCKTADADLPAKAIDGTNATVIVLNSNFIGYSTLSSATNTKSVLSNVAAYN